MHKLAQCQNLLQIASQHARESARSSHYYRTYRVYTYIFKALVRARYFPVSASRGKRGRKTARQRSIRRDDSISRYADLSNASGMPRAPLLGSVVSSLFPRMLAWEPAFLFLLRGSSSTAVAPYLCATSLFFGPKRFRRLLCRCIW